MGTIASGDRRRTARRSRCDVAPLLCLNRTIFGLQNRPHSNHAAGRSAQEIVIEKLAPSGPAARIITRHPTRPGLDVIAAFAAAGASSCRPANLPDAHTRQQRGLHSNPDRLLLAASGGGQQLCDSSCVTGVAESGVCMRR